MHPELLRALAKARHEDLLSENEPEGSHESDSITMHRILSFTPAGGITAHLGRRAHDRRRTGRARVGSRLGPTAGDLERPSRSVPYPRRAAVHVRPPGSTPGRRRGPWWYRMGLDGSPGEAGQRRPLFGRGLLPDPERRAERSPRRPAVKNSAISAPLGESARPPSPAKLKASPMRCTGRRVARRAASTAASDPGSVHSQYTIGAKASTSGAIARYGYAPSQLASVGG